MKNIFDWYIAGDGFDAIAHKLYAENIQTPSQLANKRNKSPIWHGSSVRLILENPIYTGDRVQARSKTGSEITDKKRCFNDEKDYIIVMDTHEPIISKTDFDTVQSIIASRRKNVDGTVRKLHKNVNLFTNVIKCKDCGRGFHFKRNRRGYICGGYDKHGAAVCSDHLVLEELLINTIRGDLKRLTDTIDDVEKFNVIKQKSGAERTKIKKELASFQKRLDKVYSFKKNALESMIDGKISQSDYSFIIAEKEKELQELLHRKVDLESILSETIDDNLFMQVKAEVDKSLSFENLTREVLNRYVDRIEVGEDGTVDIFYKFRGSDTIIKLLLC